MEERVERRKMKMTMIYQNWWRGRTSRAKSNEQALERHARIWGKIRSRIVEEAQNKQNKPRRLQVQEQSISA